MPGMNTETPSWRRSDDVGGNQAIPSVYDDDVVRVVGEIA
jgi:hypothetical protein